MAQLLSRKQFDILELLAAEKEPLSQRKIEERTRHSLGTINRTVRELTELGYVAKGRITGAGLDALEPYRVKRAIFIAAGFGSRLVPITFNTPKPLVRVRGQRIIDGLLDACLEAGVSEIYIVRGYLAEQFDQLLYKYPMIKFLENPIGMRRMATDWPPISRRSMRCPAERSAIGSRSRWCSARTIIGWKYGAALMRIS